MKKMEIERRFEIGFCVEQGSCDRVLDDDRACADCHAEARRALNAARRAGLHLVHPDQIDWKDIHAFQEELRKGQGVTEDAGGFFARAIRALFGMKLPKDNDVVTYRAAAKALLDDR